MRVEPTTITNIVITLHDVHTNGNVVLGSETDFCGTEKDRERLLIARAALKIRSLRINTSVERHMKAPVPLIEGLIGLLPKWRSTLVEFLSPEISG
jgi:hypothetical protein